MAGLSPSPVVPLAPASAALRLVWLRLRRNWLSAAALALIVLMMLAIQSMFFLTISNVSRSPRGSWFDGPSCIQ